MLGGAGVPRARNDDVWAFSERFADAAIARPDGSVDVFDLTSGARAVERIPVRTPRRGRPTSLVVSDKRGRSPLLVSSGTQGGDISVGSEVIAELDSSVTDIKLSDSGLVVCQGAQKKVVVVDPSNGKIHKRLSVALNHRGNISSLAISADSTRFAVCSQNISVHDLEAGYALKALSGHASPISASAFFANDSLLITGSTSDPHLFIWDTVTDESTPSITVDVESSGKKKKRRRKSSTIQPRHTLVAPEQGVRNIAIDQGNGGRFSFAAVLKSGIVAIWRHIQPDSNMAVSKPDCIVHPCSKDSEYGAPNVHGAGFRRSGVLSVLYGSNMKPEIHDIDISAVAETVILPKPSVDNLLVNSSAALRDGQVAGIDSGVSNAARAEKLAPQVGTRHLEADEKSTRRRKRDLKGSTQPNGIPGGDDTMNDASEDDLEEGNSKKAAVNEPTLSERLAALGVTSGRENKVFKTGSERTNMSAREATSSKVNILLQALESKDQRLLNSIICRKHAANVVSSTVRLLPAEVATGALLDVLANKLQSDPRQTLQLMPWVKEIAFEHAQTLRNMPRNQALRTILEYGNMRRDTLHPLLALQGRLEFITRQAERVKEHKQNNLENVRPQLEYTEEIREESEDEVDERSDEETSEVESSGAERSEESSEDDSSSESESAQEIEDDLMEVSLPNGHQSVEEATIGANGKPGGGKD